ncbi:MAG: two-component system, cell cycle response regulator [Solirubrobacteraceae bacterium]|jgi:two-component system cell cycle response regulator|nr:two-component system, cell cycle response regulator [Solirubrobacteraceae bacterium]
MIAVAAHTHAPTRAQIAEVLDRAGWIVFETADADPAMCLCREHEADVLLIGEGLGGGGASALLERVKRDADLFRTAVVMLGDDLDPAEVLAWLELGADDVLLTPPEPADLLGRAFAAARTKALVKELTARNDRLEELVLFDELTGLRNRRSMLHELDVLLAGAKRHGLRLSVLMFDVDHFKSINDRHGHRAGDEVLREVSRRLRGRLRSADLAGRLGGDELLVALPETGADGACTLAESMRAAIADGPVPTSAGPIDVTVSIGSATLHDEDLSELLERADGALYAAKAGGRDQAASA